MDGGSGGSSHSLFRPVYYEFGSPWIVATTFLECFEARNSRYHIPCQVPVANFPLLIGTVTLAPMSADLM